jgi:hypothetical protein
MAGKGCTKQQISPIGGLSFQKRRKVCQRIFFAEKIKLAYIFAEKIKLMTWIPDSGFWAQ